MRRRGIRARPCQGVLAPERLRDLDALVRTVAALDGPAASGLLEGLSEKHRPVALDLLAEVHRSERSERHAALAILFATRPRAPQLAAGIPGRLGAELRSQVAPGGPPRSDRGRDPIARWALRLALELGGG